jgi:LPPG:FO 2-phospho-L-lactate transferase
VEWFNLGDSDLATHLERTRRLKAGQPLSRITRDFCAAWGVRHTVLPMSDDPVRTIVDTDEGELPFQEYFVHRRCEPRVKGFRFAGVDSAAPAAGTREAIQSADAVVICPSNPWVSIDPILRVLSPLQMYPFGEGTGVGCVAISPIIGGKTVKGPAAKMFAELGIEPSALAVASHYEKFLSGIVVDSLDSEIAKRIRIPTLVTNTLMNSDTDRARLAQETINFIGNLP